jgi:beta-keto acid cleavage enzyme
MTVVEAERRNQLSADKLVERQAWRDRRLMALAAHKRRAAKEIGRYSKGGAEGGIIMASSEKVIITCAVTGAIHTPSMSPYLPVTADQITEAAIGVAEAGAAIVHLNARATSAPGVQTRARKRSRGSCRGSSSRPRR